MTHHPSTGYINHSTLEIHTLEALQLCEGTTAPARNGKVYRVPSAFIFGLSVNKIWDHIKNDDPFAEFALINIEQQLGKAFDTIDKFERILERRKAKWQQPEGLTLEISQAEVPTTLSLNQKVFKTTHAKLLMVVIGRFDLLMRKLLTYRQFNIIKNTRFHTMRHRSMRSIRVVMQEARTYKPTGVTRQDIINHTEDGETTTQQLGIIPLSVLTREQRSQYGPSPRPG